MPYTHLPTPPQPGHVPDFPHVPDEFEPGAPPLQPDEGPYPTTVPGDPMPAPPLTR
jgi:hypothetical protein